MYALFVTGRVPVDAYRERETLRSGRPCKPIPGSLSRRTRTIRGSLSQQALPVLLLRIGFIRFAFFVSYGITADLSSAFCKKPEKSRGVVPGICDALPVAEQA